MAERVTAKRVTAKRVTAKRVMAERATIAEMVTGPVQVARIKSFIGKVAKGKGLCSLMGQDKLNKCDESSVNINLVS